MFDQTGPANFSDIFEEYEDAYAELTVAAGARVDKGLVDTTARTGYGLIDINPKTAHEMAVEYYTFDWEYAQTPEVLVHLNTSHLDFTDGFSVAILVDCFILGQWLLS
jgi:hypothetical protein